MRVILAAVTAAGALVALVGAATTADAAPSSYSRKYAPPSAITPEEKRRNEEAYERGEYYEHDSNALPWGSPAWREQRQREIGG